MYTWIKFVSLMHYKYEGYRSRDEQVRRFCDKLPSNDLLDEHRNQCKLSVHNRVVLHGKNSMVCQPEK